MEETLRVMIELEVLPFFRKVTTLENYVALQRRHHMWGPNHTPINDLILDIAVGNLSKATRQFNVVWGQCQNYVNYIYRERRAAIRGFNKELSMLALLRDDLLSENRTGLAKTLFAWECENITRLSIEQI
ncbi:hypothetical protein U8607_01085 [Methylobacterium durans]|uniref:hypothetical protein n=1 Tax=Methylobacterium durans TaxID=2202825 RepID=UPI002AFF11D6|nr:hypothetical protein [Methylobacterium durans]MEA1830664.1 hypothetical protein [Methylobacterium durans]